MNYLNYLKADDFDKLTNDDIKKIEKEIKELKLLHGDKREWLSNNIEKIKKNPIAINIVSEKILGGQTNLKLFRIMLIRTLEETKKDLESTEFNYTAINIAGNGLDMYIYSTLFIDENTYLIRLRCDLGRKKYKGIEFDDIKYVDTLYHVDRGIIEVRASHHLACKIIKFLGVKLGFNSKEVNILEKHKNIEEFAKSINATFKKINSNTAIDISELTQEDSESLANIVMALDDFLINKNETLFLEKLKSVSFSNDELTFTYAFLAGCKQIGIAVSNDNELDVLHQGIYKVFNKYLSSGDGYILLKYDNKQYTIKVSIKSNTIRFLTSATKDIIELIIDNVINDGKILLSKFDIADLSKEIESFINLEIIKSFRPEKLMERFGLSEEIVLNILNGYEDNGLIHKSIEFISPETNIVIKEFMNNEEIKYHEREICDIYKINPEDYSENIIDFLLQNFDEYINLKYSINRENLNIINDKKIENVKNIHDILTESLNNNDSLFNHNENTLKNRLIQRLFGTKKKAS